MNAWQCDRCNKISRNSREERPGDAPSPPEGWNYTRRPIRGSEGARSNSSGILCDDCDDSFYNWWNNP